MAFQGGNQVLRDPNIVVEYEPVPCTARNDVLVPGQDADSGRVSCHGAKSPLRRNIPQLDRASAEADGQVAPVLSELDRRNVIVLSINFKELLDIAR